MEDISETCDTTWRTYEDQDEKVSKSIGFSSIWDKKGHLVWEWGTYVTKSLGLNSIWGPHLEPPEPQQQKASLATYRFGWDQMNISEKSKPWVIRRVAWGPSGDTSKTSLRQVRLHERHMTIKMNKCPKLLVLVASGIKRPIWCESGEPMIQNHCFFIGSGDHPRSPQSHNNKRHTCQAGGSVEAKWTFMRKVAILLR